MPFDNMTAATSQTHLYMAEEYYFEEEVDGKKVKRKFKLVKSIKKIPKNMKKGMKTEKALLKEQIGRSSAIKKIHSEKHMVDKQLSDSTAVRRMKVQVRITPSCRVPVAGA